MTDPSDHKSSPPPELDELARLYLDLWQDQWTALANDPMVAEAMARGFQMMGPGAAAFANFANLLGQANLYAAGRPTAPYSEAQASENTGDMGQQAGATGFPGAGLGPMPFADVTPPFARNDNKHNDQSSHTTQSDNIGSNATAGATAAGAAPAGGHGDMAQLLDRLAAMEQRLADLASALDGAGGTAGASDKPSGKKRGG